MTFTPDAILGVLPAWFDPLLGILVIPIVAAAILAMLPEAALERRKPRRQYERTLDGDGEAHFIALACQKPPEGRGRWTLSLLADRMVQLE